MAVFVGCRLVYSLLFSRSGVGAETPFVKAMSFAWCVASTDVICVGAGAFVTNSTSNLNVMEVSNKFGDEHSLVEMGSEEDEDNEKSFFHTTEVA